MDFFVFLSADSERIVEMVRRAGFAVAENRGYCRNKNLFGYVGYGKEFVICTSNIRKSGFDPYRYVPETVLHEAVHVAQRCRGGAFWNAEANMPLPWNKMNDIKKSLSMSATDRRLEHEAYWMEDKPDEVTRVLRKFCF